ncbi:DNA polymerase III subunit beta [Buchananella felis]|uniref:DNA polymerase III subunit beta n=1 Tax=Buchananella felis TaxID=3231492 RepID=UPI00352900C5
MKFTVERDVLAEAVSWTARTLPARPAVPVLAGVRLAAQSSGEVAISTFDYEVSARSVIEANVEEAGTVLVLGRLLADIVKALPNRPVTLALEGAKVEVRSGSSRFTLMTMPLDDYPELPALPPVLGNVDAHLLQQAVAQVSLAASRDETLPLLGGVRVEIDGERMRLMATDRYRLAVRELLWHPSATGLEVQALIKAKTLSDVSKSLSSGGAVELALSTQSEPGMPSLVGFAAGGRTTTSLLTEGDYPPVMRLFPTETPVYAVVRTEDLIGAVKRVSLVAERNTSIRLSFTSEGLTLEAGQGEDAHAAEEIGVLLSGEELVTAYNPHYLLDGLSAVGTEYVRLSFSHPSKPAVLTGQNEEEGESLPDFRYLLMPIRFGN